MSRKYTVGRRNSSSCLFFPTKKMWFLPYNRENPSLFEDCILGWVAKGQKRKENLSFIERTNRNAVRGVGGGTLQCNYNNFMLLKHCYYYCLGLEQQH